MITKAEYDIEKNKPKKLICLNCGYTRSSEDGKQCVMCDSYNSIEE